MFEIVPQDLVNTGPFGWLALLGFLAALLAALAAVVVAIATPGRASSRRLRLLAAAGAASLVVGFVSAFLLVRWAQGQILAPPPPPPSAIKFWSPWLFGMHEAEVGHALVAFALLPIAGLSGVAAAIHGIRRDRASADASPLAPWLVVAASLIVLAASIGLCRRAQAAATDIGCAVAVLCQVSWFDKQTSAVLAQARHLVLGVAAAGSVALALLAIRGRARGAFAQRPRDLAAGAFIFIAGAASFAGTRAMAHDARAPLPYPDSSSKKCPDLVHGSEGLPGNRTCYRYARPQDNAVGPILELRGEGAHRAHVAHVAHVDGVPVASPAEVAAMLVKKRELWLALNQGPNGPPPPILAIPAELPIAEVRPYLAALLGSSFYELAILTAEPSKLVTTRTAGDVTLSARCCCDRVRLFKGGEPLWTYATWGDLAGSAAANHSSVLNVLP